MVKEKLHSYCLNLLGTTHDYQEDWQADRYLVGGKMFALIGTDSKKKPIITLKCEPNYAQELRENDEGIIPGYYMNKTHWNSIYFDSNLSNELLEHLILHSYNLVFEKLTKKVQKQIMSK
ncbi:MmcQ/YjbR family DNA-binding protein [Bacillus sp. CLL-7-23]|uniref:MmcQ/YjbR family DNA-binding protein n=1 Tax=Bacillus changyiensis TaxID=3004103 RepID=A0ABT4X881_9BACI|nr:MmcQ/YjbR family DNA-binding protein [Bacillus changyiensis]MDA7027562.1 MmcQ/YjbR family DNA-binding protein [Bacillus changyiensis]